MPTTNDDEYFGGSADSDLPVDREELRREIQLKYAEVADDPDGDFHFHTGRTIAERCGYDGTELDELPAEVVESFAGVADPFALRPVRPGERVVDLGSGAGLDAILAARAAGPDGYVVGVDMTPEMLAKSRANAAAAGTDNVEFCFGHLEEIPVADGWADVVISNGVINLCPDKAAVMAEIDRILRPGGVLQFADIANGAEVPEGARRHIDLWTG
ncbi:MAG: methyltransferase domain-containing protein [Actinomycetota bacterium]